MNSPIYALDETNKEVALPGTFGAAIPRQFIPKALNYAEDEKTLNAVRELITPLLYMIRNNKMTLTEEWNAIRRMEMQQHDEGRKYNGRSDVYLPLWQRALSTIISQLSSGLFPSDDYLDVVNRSDLNDDENAKAVKAYLVWELETNAKVRRVLKPFLHQFTSYGNACMKYLYRMNPRYEGRKVKNAGGGMQPQFRPMIRNEGLQVSARSIFNMHVYPFTAENLDECNIVAEDIEVSRKYIDDQIANGNFKNAAEAISGFRPAEFDIAQIEQLDVRGGMPGGQAAHGYSAYAERRVLTEVWCYLKLPQSAYVDGEDTSCDVPVRILFAGFVPVVVTRNPYWHQMPPYLFGRQNVEAGCFWGYGSGRVIRQLQYLANDFANQANDAGIYALNPMALINPALISGPMPSIRPGATISVSDIQQAVQFISPPAQVAQEGLGFMQMAAGMVSDFSGAPPILQGSGAKGAAKTATGAQILQKNSMAPLQDIVEDLELDVMVPMVYGAWVNAQQFRTDDVMAIVAGRPVRVSPEQLAIDADFRWLGSSQAVNSQMRSQQAIGLISAVMPLVPLLNQQGYIVDFRPIIQKVFNDGFGFRGFEEFIHKMNPQEQMAALQQMGAIQGAQNPGAPQAEQASRVRSAVEQAGAGDMSQAAQPGEGEDFMAMRNAVEGAGTEGGSNQ